MFSLILKDLFMQKKGILYGVIYVAVIVLAFHGANGAGPIAGAAAIASAMVAVTYMLPLFKDLSAPRILRIDTHAAYGTIGRMKTFFVEVILCAWR